MALTTTHPAQTPLPVNSARSASRAVVIGRAIPFTIRDPRERRSQGGTSMSAATFGALGHDYRFLSAALRCSAMRLEPRAGLRRPLFPWLLLPPGCARRCCLPTLGAHDVSITSGPRKSLARHAFLGRSRCMSSPRSSGQSAAPPAAPETSRRLRWFHPPCVFLHHHGGIFTSRPDIRPRRPLVFGDFNACFAIGCLMPDVDHSYRVAQD